MGKISNIIMALFVSLMIISCFQQEQEHTDSIINRGEEPLVLICVSSASERYHKDICRGLEKCTHEIRQVTLEEAKSMGRTPCKICYKLN